MYSNTFVPIFKLFAIDKPIFKDMQSITILKKIIITFFFSKTNKHNSSLYLIMLVKSRNFL